MGKAMAGHTGSFLLTGYNLRVAEWSGTTVRDVNDCTGFASGQFRENLGGMKVFRGSASGYLEYDATNTAIGSTMGTADYTGVAFTLTATTGCTITGTAIVSMVGLGTGVNGNGTGSLQFVSTGAFTETWDTTP
jgi:predicted secreted protein